MVQFAASRPRHEPDLVVVGTSTVTDLDRSCRLALSKSLTQSEIAIEDTRPRDVLGSVRSVERAGSLLSSMAQRVRDQTELSEATKIESAKLRSERDHLAAQCNALTEKLAAEIDNSVSHEALAKKHESDAKLLAIQLSKALADIDALTAVITTTFGPPVKTAKSA